MLLLLRLSFFRLVVISSSSSMLARCCCPVVVVLYDIYMYRPTYRTPSLDSPDRGNTISITHRAAIDQGLINIKILNLVCGNLNEFRREVVRRAGANMWAAPVSHIPSGTAHLPAVRERHPPLPGDAAQPAEWFADTARWATVAEVRSPARSP